METGAIIILAFMVGIPVGFYAYRLNEMRKMGKMTLPKKQIVRDFSEATDDLDYLHFEQDETFHFAK